MAKSKKKKRKSVKSEDKAKSPKKIKGKQENSQTKPGIKKRGRPKGSTNKPKDPVETPEVKTPEAPKQKRQIPLFPQDPPEQENTDLPVQPPKPSRLDLMRAECQKYNIMFGAGQGERELEMFLAAAQKQNPAIVIPPADDLQPDAVPQSESVVVSSDNIDDVLQKMQNGEIQPEASTRIPGNNQQVNIPRDPRMPAPLQNQSGIDLNKPSGRLENVKIICGTIVDQARNHWRTIALSELRGICSNTQYPFTINVVQNPQNPALACLQVEIDGQTHSFPPGGYVPVNPEF